MCICIKENFLEIKEMARERERSEKFYTKIKKNYKTSKIKEESNGVNVVIIVVYWRLGTMD